jgi:hypothetical protein
LFGSPNKSPQREASDAPTTFPSFRGPIRAPAGSPVRPNAPKSVHSTTATDYSRTACSNPEREEQTRLHPFATAQPTADLESPAKAESASSSSRRKAPKRLKRNWTGAELSTTGQCEQEGESGAGGVVPGASDGAAAAGKTKRGGPDKISSALQLSAAQLQQLTNRNTARNRQHYNRLDTITVYRDEPRPPSPSAKLRSPGKPQTKESMKSSRDERARKRQALGQNLKDHAEVEGPEGGSETAMSLAIRKHFFAAGDEEGGFESPVKPQRNKKFAKTVKWDRELIKEPSLEPYRRERTDESNVQLRRIVKVRHRCLNIVPLAVC